MEKEIKPPTAKSPPYRNKIEIGAEIEVRGLKFRISQIESHVEADSSPPMIDQYGAVIRSGHYQKYTLTIEAGRYQ